MTPAEPKANVSDLVWACAGVPVQRPNNSRARATSLFITEPFRTLAVPYALSIVDDAVENPCTQRARDVCRSVDCQFGCPRSVQCTPTASRGRVPNPKHLRVCRTLAAGCGNGRPHPAPMHPWYGL